MSRKKILVVGMARSGIAAAELLSRLGALPVISDTKSEEAFDGQLAHLRELGCEFRLGEEQTKLLEEVEGVIISPGVPIQAPLVIRAKELGLPLIGELELAASVLEGNMFAISGTNGKTTTVTLLWEIMKATGKTAHVGGNIGYPLSKVAMIARETSVTVVEVSSFQLETVQTFRPHIAALLNITEDHLNRHGTMEEYIRLKKRIFENQTKDDVAVLNKQDPILREMAEQLQSKVLFFSRTEPVEEGTCVQNGKMLWCHDGQQTYLCDTEKIRIPGNHNLENALAAAAMACAAGVEPEVIRDTLYTFAGVEHRIETVRCFEGVTYINDSKGTNVDSTIKAVQSMKVPTVIILGGFDKHTDFAPLCKEMVASGLISHAVIIGQTGDQIEHQLNEAGFHNITRANSMQDAVEKSRHLAVFGGNVLLSPACASFDMFRDFEQRGKVFKDIVNRLQ